MAVDKRDRVRSAAWPRSCESAFCEIRERKRSARAAADENARRAYALAAVGRNLCDGPTLREAVARLLGRKPDD